jgi:3-oxoacyl-[acyl-carrier protein] reductase
MINSLNNKVIVITGAGGGIGRAIAEALAGTGARLALCGGNNIEKLNQTAELVKAHNGEVFVLPGDLTGEAFQSSCLDLINEHFGAIDVLINNAGIAINAPFEKTTPEQFDNIFNINVRVPYILCQRALPFLRKSDYAAIINISSAVGHKGYPDQSAYSATKHALLGFTKALANEVYRENIRVHAVSPGGVYTELIRKVRPDLSAEGMIMPEEVADAIVFLLSYRGNAVIDEINIHRNGKEPFDI